MNIEKFSALPFNNLDAATYIINDSITQEEDPGFGLDLGDNQVAIFEVRELEDGRFYLKESLESDDGVVVDEDTKGEYDVDELVEIIIYRLQVLDDITDYPRLQPSKKQAIEKALAVAGVTLKYDPDQPRDDAGRFGSGGGSSEGNTISAAGARTTGGGSAPKKLTTEDSQRKLKVDTSKLPAGKARDINDRSIVLKAYQEKVAFFNPGYKTGADKGAVWNSTWTQGTKAPKDWPKDVPFSPRAQNPKVGDFNKEYEPFATKGQMMGWMKEGDVGAHKAAVALHELYAFAQKRQGNIDKLTYGATGKDVSMNRFLEKHKLAGFDVDMHHMIPAAMGGSNNGANVVALTPKEHAIAHVLEWSAARVYKSNGEVAKQGKWGGTQPTFEGTGANIKSNNIYRALTLQTTAAFRSGNPKEYFKQGRLDPGRAQATFAMQKAMDLMFKMKLIDTNDINKLKLDKTGRPIWSGKISKAEVIKKLEASFMKKRK